MTDAIRITGINGEVLQVTVWATPEGAAYFEFELSFGPDDDPHISIEITPEDAIRLAMALAGTALRYQPAPQTPA